MPASRRTTARLAVDGVTTLLFLGAVLAPAVDQCVRPVSAREPHEENRNARPMPDAPRTLAQLSKYPAAVEAHHADTFGLRDVLLRWNSVIKMRTWALSPTPTVVIDPSGWLDYAGDRTFDVLRGTDPMDARTLDRWMTYFTKCRAFCARNGAQYLYVSVPNKETVYPDHVPSLYRPLGPSRQDQVVAALPGDVRASYMDLRPVLSAARVDDRPGSYLYFEYGTHWNGRGGWVAYHALMQRLAPDFPEVRVLTDADVEWRATPPMDFDSWGPRLYQPGAFGDVVQMCNVKGPQKWSAIGTDSSELHFHVRNPTAAGPRVLVFSDSFGPAFWTFFATTFREADFVQAGLDPGLILSEHPDLVIELRVERIFAGWPLFSPAAEEMMDPAYAPSGREDLVLSVDPSGKDALFASDGAEVVREGDGIVFRTRDSRSGWVLPPFDVPDMKHAWLHVEIESPTAGTLLAFRRQGADGPWLRRDMNSIHYAAGRHAHVVPLHGGIFGAQQIRLALLDTPGRVVVRHLEVHTTDR